jgi:P-type Cu+ transporter
MVDGMTCTQCVAAIANALRVPVPTATVSLGVVELPDAVLIEQVTEIIESIGYDVVQVVGGGSGGGDGEDNHHDDEFNPRAVWDSIHKQYERELRKSKRLFILSLLLTLPIAVWEWILCRLIPTVPIIYQHGSLVITIDTIILGCCATLVQFVCGFDFYKKTYYGSTGMHVLVAIATTTAYFYAIYNAISGDAMAAFDTATVLITFVLCGQYLQASAMQRTRNGLERLMELQSRTAVRVLMMMIDNENGNGSYMNPLEDAYQEESVPIQQVVVGDLLKVIRGASIPTDGIMAHGTMEVDESMVTGESLPVLKTEGSVLLGGTVCRDGVAFFRVTAVGADTALSQIMRIVQEAQTSAVPIQTMVDRVAEVFVPIVCTFSLITYLVWYVLFSRWGWILLMKRVLLPPFSPLTLCAFG